MIVVQPVDKATGKPISKGIIIGFNHAELVALMNGKAIEQKFPDNASLEGVFICAAPDDDELAEMLRSSIRGALGKMPTITEYEIGKDGKVL